MLTGICDPNKSRAWRHRSLKLGSKLKYLNHGKCLELLDTEQFQKLNHDQTKTIERKVQNALRKIKSKLQLTSTNEYIRPARPQENSMAKIHKLSDRDGVEKLPIRPIISNLNTALLTAILKYHLAKYLLKLLLTLKYLRIYYFK